MLDGSKFCQVCGAKVAGGGGARWFMRVGVGLSARDEEGGEHDKDDDGKGRRLVLCR